MLMMLAIQQQSLYTGVGYATRRGRKKSGVMMMMSVFLMASSCRYHGTSLLLDRDGG